MDGVSVRRRTSGVCLSNRVTISVSEGLLVPIFCVLRVRTVISVVGGGGAGGCGCAPASDFSVGGGGRLLGLALVAVSFAPMMGEATGWSNLKNRVFSKTSPV
jgi:hypothetical protein